MFDRASQYMVDSLIEGGSIKLDERGLYLYCFGMFFEMLANLVTTVLIGIVFEEVIATFIFMLVFISLRSTAGGYHSETSGKCYILSMSIFLMIILSYNFISYIPTLIIVIICIVDFIIVIIFSPIASPNKPLSPKERSENRVVSIILTFVFTVILIIMLKFKSVYAYVFFESISASVISMLFGYINCQKVQRNTIRRL